MAEPADRCSEGCEQQQPAAHALELVPVAATVALPAAGVPVSAALSAPLHATLLCLSAFPPQTLRQPALELLLFAAAAVPAAAVAVTVSAPQAPTVSPEPAEAAWATQSGPRSSSSPLGKHVPVGADRISAKPLASTVPRPSSSTLCTLSPCNTGGSLGQSLRLVCQPGIKVSRSGEVLRTPPTWTWRWLPLRMISGRVTRKVPGGTSNGCPFADPASIAD